MLPHRVILATALLLTLVTPAAAQKPEVDLLLVLAADVSRSMDDAKFNLQRNGYVAAITHPQVLETILSGPHRRIGLTFIEWSSSLEQNVLVDWTLIDSSTAAHRFVVPLVELGRPFASSTAIGAAIQFSMQRLKAAPFAAARHTIDISGDGTENSTRSQLGSTLLKNAQRAAESDDVTINGLPILTNRTLPDEHTNPPGGLALYYRKYVATSAGFVIVAENFESFGKALKKKMIAEIAQLR